MYVYVCDDSIKHQLVSVSRHCCGRGVEREQLARVSLAIRQVSRRALILGALPARRSAVYLSCIPLLPPPPPHHHHHLNTSLQTLPFKTSPLMPLLLLSVFGHPFKCSYIGNLNCQLVLTWYFMALNLTEPRIHTNW